MKNFRWEFPVCCRQPPRDTLLCSACSPYPRRAGIKIYILSHGRRFRIRGYRSGEEGCEISFVVEEGVEIEADFHMSRHFSRFCPSIFTRTGRATEIDRDTSPEVLVRRTCAFHRRACIYRYLILGPADTAYRLRALKRLIGS